VVKRPAWGADVWEFRAFKLSKTLRNLRGELFDAERLRQEVGAGIEHRVVGTMALARIAGW